MTGKLGSPTEEAASAVATITSSAAAPSSHPNQSLDGRCHPSHLPTAPPSPSLPLTRGSFLLSCCHRHQHGHHPVSPQRPPPYLPLSLSPAEASSSAAATATSMATIPSALSAGLARASRAALEHGSATTRARAVRTPLYRWEGDALLYVRRGFEGGKHGTLRQANTPFVTPLSTPFPITHLFLGAASIAAPTARRQARLVSSLGSRVPEPSSARVAASGAAVHPGRYSAMQERSAMRTSSFTEGEGGGGGQRHCEAHYL